MLFVKTERQVCEGIPAQGPASIYSHPVGSIHSDQTGVGWTSQGMAGHLEESRIQASSCHIPISEEPPGAGVDVMCNPRQSQDLCTEASGNSFQLKMRKTLQSSCWFIKQELEAIEISPSSPLTLARPRQRMGPPQGSVHRWGPKLGPTPRAVLVRALSVWV